MEGFCDWKSCKRESTLTYLGKELCNDHWNKLCEMQDENKGKAARKKIGLPPEQEKTIDPDDDADDSGITLGFLELEPDEEPQKVETEAKKPKSTKRPKARKCRTKKF